MNTRRTVLLTLVIISALFLGGCAIGGAITGKMACGDECAKVGFLAGLAVDINTVLQPMYAPPTVVYYEPPPRYYDYYYTPTPPHHYRVPPAHDRNRYNNHRR
jgi:hypothetical protein